MKGSRDDDWNDRDEALGEALARRRALAAAELRRLETAWLREINQLGRVWTRPNRRVA